MCTNSSLLFHFHYGACRRAKESRSITAIVWATHRAIFCFIQRTNHISVGCFHWKSIENTSKCGRWSSIKSHFASTKEKLALIRIEFSVSGSWNKTSTLRKGQSNFLLSMVINARKISINFELFKPSVDYTIIHNIMIPLEIISTHRRFFFNYKWQITSKIHTCVSTAIATKLQRKIKETKIHHKNPCIASQIRQS